MNARSRLLSAFFATLASAVSCDDPSQFLPPNISGGPAGIIDGTIDYTGPMPCTANGHIVGAAVLLVFDINLLPPPEGLGTTAQSLAVVAGDDLFAGIKDRLTFNDDGSMWCPDASAPSVVAGASWAAGPLSAGTYEVRGFYDIKGVFNPGFSISNLPVKGDIAGGAIDDPTDVAQGNPPVFRQITLGDKQQDGSLAIPPEGAHVGEVVVTLGLVLPLERPIFYPKSVTDPTKQNKDPLHVTMPSDFQLATFSQTDPTDTEKSFIELDLGAGVAPSESAVAAAPPFNLPVLNPKPTLQYSRQDVNGDGVIDKQDHVPESALVPALYPLSVFAKLQDGQELVNQSSPVVVVQGLTIYKSLLQTAATPTTLNEADPDVIIALRPATLCIDPTDLSKQAVLVVSRKTDAQGHPILADEAGVKASLAAQFHRPVDIQYGCLPQGTYTMNLIYSTGQAWTLPNEAAICSALETPQTDTQCGSRARLKSQAATLTIGAPKDASYCEKNPTPAACSAQ